MSGLLRDLFGLVWVLAQAGTLCRMFDRHKPVTAGDRTICGRCGIRLTRKDTP